MIDEQTQLLISNVPDQGHEENALTHGLNTWMRRFEKGLLWNGLQDPAVVFRAHTTFNEQTSQTLFEDFGFFSIDDKAVFPDIAVSSHTKVTIAKERSLAFSPYCEWVSNLSGFLPQTHNGPHYLELMICLEKKNLSTSFCFLSDDLGDVFVDTVDRLIKRWHD